MKRKDIILVIGVLLLAAAAWLILGQSARGTAVEIRLHGEVYAQIPQGEVRTVTVEQGDGKTNIVKLDKTGVWMDHSTCSNQICVNTGKILYDHEEGLSLTKSIVCLPNGVTVELVDPEGDE